MLLFYEGKRGTVVQIERCANIFNAKYLASLRLKEFSSRIHERRFSFRFLGLILRVLRLKVSVYVQCLHYKPVSKGIKFVSRGDCE